MKNQIENKMFSNRQIANLIWPLLVEQILNTTVGIADVIMVSTLGEHAVSGVSLVDSINVLLFGLLTALGTGGAVVASQYFGRRDPKMAEKTAIQLIYTMLFLSAAVTVIMILFRSVILHVVFGQVEKNVMEASLQYFWITMLALPGIALYCAVAAIFRAQGNSRVSMYASILINIINIGGNAFCIYGLKMGVEGVAIPTTLSRIGAAFLLVILMLREKPFNDQKPISIRRLFREPVDFGLIAKVLRIGIPNGLENSVFQIGKIMVLSLVATFGTTAIAANAAGNLMASIEILPPQSVSIAMLTVVGQCVGAGDNRQARYYTRKLMLIAYAAMLLWNIPLLLCTKKILGFYHLSAETTELAWWMAMTHGVLGLIWWPASFTLPNALRAANDATFTMVVSITSMFVIRIGMSYVFKYTQICGLIPLMGWPQSFGGLGSWIAMTIDWVLRTSFFIWRWVSGKWQGRKLI